MCLSMLKEEKKKKKIKHMRLLIIHQLLQKLYLYFL